jgi:hypothetical protein
MAADLVAGHRGPTEPHRLLAIAGASWLANNRPRSPGPGPRRPAEGQSRLPRSAQEAWTPVPAATDYGAGVAAGSNHHRPRGGREQPLPGCDASCSRRRRRRGANPGPATTKVPVPTAQTPAQERAARIQAYWPRSQRSDPDLGVSCLGDPHSVSTGAA